MGIRDMMEQHTGRGDNRVAEESSREHEAPSLALFGLFGRTNLGNEATIAAFLDSVRRRYPDATIACIGPDVSQVTRMHGIPLITMDPLPISRRLWRLTTLPFGRPLAHAAHLLAEPLRAAHARARIREYDMLIVPGTGILDDFGQSPLDLPYHLMRWCRAARAASVPIHFLSVGAERIRGRAIRVLLKKATELASYRSYRDEESRSFAKELGVETSDDPVVPDLAFGLPLEWLPTDRPVESPPQQVGIGVMGYYGWNEPKRTGERIYRTYIDKLTRFVSWLFGKGLDVRLLIGDTATDARPVQELIQEFPNHLEEGATPRLIAEPIESFEDLLRQIAETDLVVGTRFHNVLLSLLLERPVVSLSYSPKNDSLMRLVGLGAHTQAVGDFDEQRLMASVEHLAREGAEWSVRLRAMNASFRARLQAQVDRVLGGGA